MKKIFLILLLLSYGYCFSQYTRDSTKPKHSGQHTIYTELLGNVFFYGTIGYDYTIKLNEKHKIAFNCGIQFSPTFDTDLDSYLDELLFSVAPQISYLYAYDKNHHLELGIGGTLFLMSRKNNPMVINRMIPFRFGYRYQKENGGLFFKIAYTPMLTTLDVLSLSTSGDFWWSIPVWFGVAVGYTFK